MSYTRSTSYMTMPGRTLSTRNNVGSSTPTLDAMKAQRAASSWGMPSSPRIVPRSVSAAFNADLSTTSYSSTSATPRTSTTSSVALHPTSSSNGTAETMGGRTAMLNFNMLESRINAIEERYEKHGSQLKSDLREWFVSSFGNLESTVTTSLSEQQANLDEQHQHFTAACAQLERKLKVTEDQLRLKVEGVHRELTEAVESVERYGRDSVAKQNAHLDLALTEFSHEVQAQVATTETRLAGRIADLDADLNTRIDSDCQRVSDKYADVCLGLDGKLTAAETATRSRIDSVVDSVNKSLQAFDAEVDKSMKLMVVRLQDVDAAGTLRTEMLDQKIDGRLKALTTTTADKFGDVFTKLGHETGARLQAAKAFAEEVAAVAAAAATSQSVAAAEYGKATDRKIADSIELIDRQAKRMEKSDFNFSMLQSDQLAPMEKAMLEIGDMLNSEGGVADKIEEFEEILAEFEIDLMRLDLTNSAAL